MFSDTRHDGQVPYQISFAVLDADQYLCSGVIAVS